MVVLSLYNAANVTSRGYRHRCLAAKLCQFKDSAMHCPSSVKSHHGASIVNGEGMTTTERQHENVINKKKILVVSPLLHVSRHTPAAG